MSPAGSRGSTFHCGAARAAAAPVARARQLLWVLGLLLGLAGATFIAWRVAAGAVKASAGTARESGARLAGLDLPVLAVEPGAGIWWTGQDGAQVIQVRAPAAGERQEVDLCAQARDGEREGERDATLLPLRLLDARLLMSTSSASALRTPLLLSPAWLAGLPAAVIRGNAGPGPARLQLSVPDGTENARLVTDLPAAAQAQPASRADAWHDHAWLLWRRLSAGGTPPVERYGAALVVERVPDPTCPWGHLQVQLFGWPDAQAAPAVPLRSWVFVLPRAGGVRRYALVPGRYFGAPTGDPGPAAPDARESVQPASEEQQLFDALRARALLHADGLGGIALAPADVADTSRLPDDARLASDWNALPASPALDRLVTRLYQRADGAAVRAAVDSFDQYRLWSALRLRRADAVHLSVPAWAGTPVLIDGRRVAARLRLPDPLVRLQRTLDEGWTPWLRVGEWPDAARDTSLVDYRVTLPDTAGGRYQLLVLGRFVGLQGAQVASGPEDACDGPACQVRWQLQRLSLQVPAGAARLVIQVHPQALPQGARPLSGAGLPVTLTVRGPEWRDLPGGQGAPGEAPEVTVRSAEGGLLFEHGAATARAWKLGLAPLVGVDPAQAHAVGPLLGRLGRLDRLDRPVRVPGPAGSDATLTVQEPLQQLALRALQCVVTWQGRFDGQRCSAPGRAPGGQATAPVGPVAGAATPARPPTDPAAATRRAALVILDADSGAVLAAASVPLLPPPADATELLAFDRFNPAASPLRVRAWQHEGGVRQAPGSSFKLVTALGLEQAARADPTLSGLLDGEAPDRIDTLPLARSYGFSTTSACYPLPCAARRDGAGTRGGHPRISNFEGDRPVDLARQGRFGLREALSGSLNSWFAWLAERSDATLAGPAQATGASHPDARALDAAALDTRRPVLGVAHRLGFGQALRLDGGLLPPDFDWQDDDVLQSTPSRFDPVVDRHEVRQQAIGLRMQVTPLQMARVAAAIATGRAVPARLLERLDDRIASAPPGTPLGLRLDRVRAGMQAVVSEGTARTAFAALAGTLHLADLYGKTGTAPEPGGRFNTAWFVGYADPGAVPGLAHRLAFACMVEHTPDTGGAVAAPLVAGVLAGLASAPGKPLAQ